MHELLLFAQIPLTRHSQLLHILTGLAAMQPVPICERHAIYKPARPRVQPTVQVGGTQAVQSTQKQSLQKQASRDLFYVTLVQELKGSEETGLDSRDGRGFENGRSESSGALGSGDGKWAIRLTDVPEPAKRPVTMRFVSVTDIVEGDAHKHMLALGYNFVDEYVLTGHRLIQNNVIFLLHRLHHPVFSNPSADASTENSNGIHQMPALSAPQDAPRSTLPSLSSMQLVDPSGAYVLQASVRVMDGTKPEIVTAATKELLAAQTELKGVVRLRVVDRLALDTRVK